MCPCSGSFPVSYLYLHYFSTESLPAYPCIISSLPLALRALRRRAAPADIWCAARTGGGGFKWSAPKISWWRVVMRCSEDREERHGAAVAGTKFPLSLRAWGSLRATWGGGDHSSSPTDGRRCRFSRRPTRHCLAGEASVAEIVRPPGLPALPSRHRRATPLDGCAAWIIYFLPSYFVSLMYVLGLPYCGFFPWCTPWGCLIVDCVPWFRSRMSSWWLSPAGLARLLCLLAGVAVCKMMLTAIASHVRGELASGLAPFGSACLGPW
jgi:hypothetical protein